MGQSMSDNPIKALSPSSLDLWEQCPRKFQKQKVEGRSGGTSEAAVLGTFVHSVLEALMMLPDYERTIEQARRLTLEEWGEFVASSEWLELLEEVGAPDISSFRRNAWSSICGYFDIEKPADVEVLATEQMLEGVLGEVPVRGIVDRLERDVFGDVVVSDYKTGKVPAPWFRAGKLRQLNIYAALVHNTTGERPAEGRLLFTTYSEVIGTTFTPESIDAAVESASLAWSGIATSAAIDTWEPQPGPLCGWCPFVGECPEGLAEVRERRAAGKLKRTAPAWEMAGQRAEEENQPG